MSIISQRGEIKQMPSNTTYLSIHELPTEVSVFPLQGAILFPRAQLPLNVFEPRYISMIDDALKSNRFLAIIQPSPSEGSAETNKLQNVGTLGKITEFSETGDGRYLISLTGICRFRALHELSINLPYRRLLVSYEEFSADLLARAGEENSDRAAFIDSLKGLSEVKNFDIDWDSIHNAPTEAIINAVSMMVPMSPTEKQTLLEAPTLGERAQTFITTSTLSLLHAKKVTLQ